MMPVFSGIEQGRDQYAIDLLEVLHGPYATPVGAYCVALVTFRLLEKVECYPPAYLMRAAADCLTISDAIHLANVWIAEENGRRS